MSKKNTKSGLIRQLSDAGTYLIPGVLKGETKVAVRKWGYNKPKKPALKTKKIIEHVLEDGRNWVGLLPATLNLAVFDCDSADPELSKALYLLLRRHLPKDVPIWRCHSSKNDGMRWHFVIPVKHDFKTVKWRGGEFISRTIVIIWDWPGWSRIVRELPKATYATEEDINLLLWGAARRGPWQKDYKGRWTKGERNNAFFKAAINEYLHNGARDLDRVIRKFKKSHRSVKKSELKATLGSAKRTALEKLDTLDMSDKVAELNRYVFSLEDNRMIDTKLFRSIPVAAFDARMRPMFGPVKSAHAELLASEQITYVQRKEYRPDLPTGIFENDGEPYLNVHRMPLTADPTPEGIDFYENMVQPLAELLTGDDNHEHLLDWFAWVVAHPEILPGWGVILHGPRGIGKSALIELLVQMVGPENRRMVRDKELRSDKNGWALEGRLFVLGEMHRARKDDFQALANLGMMITDPTIAVRAMYADAQDHPNFACLIGSTNSLKVMNADAIGRRWWPVTCGSGELNQELRTALFDRAIGIPHADFFAEWWSKYRRLAPEVASLLMDRDLSGFQHERPDSAHADVLEEEQIADDPVLADLELAVANLDVLTIELAYALLADRHPFIADECSPYTMRNYCHKLGFQHTGQFKPRIKTKTGRRQIRIYRRSGSMLSRKLMTKQLQKQYDLLKMGH